MPYGKSNKSIQDSAFKLRSGNKPSPTKFFGIHKFLSGMLTAGNRILGKGGKGGNSHGPTAPPPKTQSYTPPSEASANSGQTEEGKSGFTPLDTV